MYSSSSNYFSRSRVQGGAKIFGNGTKYREGIIIVTVPPPQAAVAGSGSIAKPVWKDAENYVKMRKRLND